MSYRDRRVSRRAVVTVVVIVGVVGVLAFGVVVVDRALRTTPCDNVQFRSSAAPGPEPPPPPIGQGPLVHALRVAFGRTSPSVFCDDFPDPFVLRVGSSYYAFSTQTAGMHLPVLTTGGLFGAGKRKDALPTLPSWADGLRVWAPSIFPVAGHYVMYYAASVRGRPGECLSHAIADQPAGPYIDTSPAPFVCPAPGGAIDPSPFVDSDGRKYLVWKNYDDVTGIVGAPLAPDSLSLAGPPRLLLVADQPWEGGIVEGPSMVNHDGRYYLFYSGHQWESARYAIGYAVCSTPLGPCTRAPGPWLASNAKVEGPGGEEFFTDTSGRLWMVFHAWVHGKIGYPSGGRTLFVLPVQFVNGAPVAG